MNRLIQLLLSTCLLWAGGAARAEEMHQHAAPATKPATVRPELGSSAAFGPDGTLWVASKQGEHIVVQASRDEGQHWSAPTIVNTRPEAISADGENRPKLAFTREGRMLLTWTHPLGKPYSGEIRLAHSADGQHFSTPITVHRDRREITHRFDSLLASPDGRIVVAWIDKRDLETARSSRQPYRGAAIYAAVSTDQGESFAPEFKLADHSCECCRIASASDTDGAPLLLWRHVFAPNERDHALIRLRADNTPDPLRRATFDRWKIDACPHHGPSLAVDDNGERHAVWFNNGQVFYGRLGSRGDTPAIEGQRPVGGARAAHADLVASAGQVAVVWKEFDGERTQLHALLLSDRGKTVSSRIIAATEGASDQPRALAHHGKHYAFWRTEQEGFRLIPLP